ncbi:hypothetical protein ROZALSC1DRAFT_30057, partial [Rozella allomycis CSF55]
MTNLFQSFKESLPKTRKYQTILLFASILISSFIAFGVNALIVTYDLKKFSSLGINDLTINFVDIKEICDLRSFKGNVEFVVKNPTSYPVTVQGTTIDLLDPNSKEIIMTFNYSGHFTLEPMKDSTVLAQDFIVNMKELSGLFNERRFNVDFKFNIITGAYWIPISSNKNMKPTLDLDELKSDFFKFQVNKLGFDGDENGANV